MAYLLVTKGAQAGERYPLTAGEYLIGRNPTCDINLTDSSVSRQHAKIRALADGTFVVEDANSSYGTLVNRQKVTQAALLDKAELQLGGAVMEFHLDDAEPADAADGYTIMRVLGEQTPAGELEQTDGRLLERIEALNKRLHTAYDISAIITSTYDLTELYKKILTSIFATIPVERGSILLWDAAHDELQHRCSLDTRGGAEEVPYSRTIVRKVIDRGESLLISNAQTDTGFDASNSVFAYNIRSAMCVPLRAHDEIIGVINADASGAAVFQEEDLQLLTLIGSQAGIVVQNARLIDENIKAARLAAVGQTVASLAHCIKNILQGLKGGASLMDQGLEMDSKEMTDVAWKLVKTSQQRISELVLNMLDYSKERQPAYQSADLREHMENIRALMTDRAREKLVRIELAYDEATPAVECDPMGIYRATLNLCTNAIDAVEPETGVVTIHVRPDATGEHVLIGVADNGSGIPEEVRAKLFEAFHSTKDSKGTGLGLAVSKKIINEHRGEILLETEVGQGTTFTLRLPIKRPAAEQTAQ